MAAAWAAMPVRPDRGDDWTDRCTARVAIAVQQRKPAAMGRFPKVGRRGFEPLNAGFGPCRPKAFYPSDLQKHIGGIPADPRS